MLTAAEWRFAAQKAREGHPMTWDGTWNAEGPCLAISVTLNREICPTPQKTLEIARNPTLKIHLNNSFYEALQSLPGYDDVYAEIHRLIYVPYKSRNIAIEAMERKAAQLEEFELQGKEVSDEAILVG